MVKTEEKRCRESKTCWHKNTASSGLIIILIILISHVATILAASLNFLHIPKTGGSSIEKAAASYGYQWGYCLFDRGSRNLSICPRKKIHTPLNMRNKNWTWWHYPVQHLPASVRKVYNDSNLFVVVRNPYDRFVSEYYYRCMLKKKFCKRKGIPKGKTMNSQKYMNDFISSKLQQFQKCSPKNLTCYYMDGAHFIPQFDYVFDHNGQQLVDHVLHFENLDQEFTELMDVYNLPFNITAHTVRNRTARGILTFQDLNLRTIKLINQIYEKDFEIGGYKMVDII